MLFYVQPFVSKVGGVMSSITANDLKRNGIAGIERVMADNHETSVTVDVRGKAKYVILSVDEFNQYREYQLEQAIKESEKCIETNQFEVINDFDNYAQTLEQEIKGGI